MALEKAREKREQTFEEIETHHPGFLVAQDTFYVGYLKGVGRIYQQTVIDTYSAVAFAKLYTTKTPITAADTLNDRVLPFFEAESVPMMRILTDRGSEYFGSTAIPTSSSWNSMTSNTRERRRGIRRRTGSSSASTRRC